jgi:hypothetical protein
MTCIGCGALGGPIPMCPDSGPDVGAGAVAARCEEAGGGAFKSGGGIGLCLECSGRGWCGGHELRFLDGRGGRVGVKGRHAGAFDCLPFSVEGTQAVFIARRAEERRGGGAPLCAELGVVIADGVRAGRDFGSRLPWTVRGAAVHAVERLVESGCRIILGGCFSCDVAGVSRVGVGREGGIVGDGS